MTSENNLEKAKKIYFQYGQSGFHMMREGILEEYKQYGISKKQEELWTNEFLEEKIQRFDINNQNDYTELIYIISTKNKHSIIKELNNKIR